MSTIAAIILIPIIILCVTLHFSDLFAGIFYSIGNPIARRLGLQDAPAPKKNIPHVKIAKVVEVKESLVRVEFEGTTWFAKRKEGTENLVFGDEVKVEDREGLTLIVAKNV